MERYLIVDNPLNTSYITRNTKTRKAIVVKCLGLPFVTCSLDNNIECYDEEHALPYATYQSQTVNLLCDIAGYISDYLDMREIANIMLVNRRTYLSVLYSLKERLEQPLTHHIQDVCLPSFKVPVSYSLTKSSLLHGCLSFRLGNTSFHYIFVEGHILANLRVISNTSIIYKDFRQYENILPVSYSKGTITVGCCSCFFDKSKCRYGDTLECGEFTIRRLNPLKIDSYKHYIYRFEDFVDGSNIVVGIEFNKGWWKNICTDRGDLTIQNAVLAYDILKTLTFV